MDRSINIETHERKENTEITEFMKELEDTLKGNEHTNTKNEYSSIYLETLNEIDLANKYKNKLKSIIKECMRNESYDNDFCYVNYNETKNTFSLDYYSEGTYSKIPITPQDIKESGLKVGMTYLPFEDGSLVEEDSIKDSIKIDVDYALFSLDNENAKRGSYE